MKNVRLIMMMLALAGVTVFTSCGDDDDESGVSGTIDITITGLPSGVDADVTVINENGEETAVTASTTLTDLPLGTYDIDINSVESDGSTYVGEEDEITVVLTGAEAEDVAINYDEFSTINGVIGTWVSAGEDVAPLLSTFFAVDSIVAVFNSNQTYEVLQYAGGATSPLTLTGTFTQELSDVGAIWTITVDQSAPSAITSEGIFEVDASMNPNSMQYEIVQTSPDIQAIPPTPEAGFGSTNGGVLGDDNIQVYKRRSF